MLAGLVIYLWGQRHLPREQALAQPVTSAPVGDASAARDTFLLLLGIGLAVTVFRGAYEQIGNTFALWMRDDVDRVIGGVRDRRGDVLLAEPAAGHGDDAVAAGPLEATGGAGRELSVMHKMAAGALIVAASYLLVAGAEAASPDGRAHWLWLLSFFLIFTLGRALHPAQRAWHLRSARAAEAGREHGRRLVPRDLHRKPRCRAGRPALEPCRPH